MGRNRLFLSPPHMGEKELKFVKEAFESNYIAPLGPQVDAFEKAFSEYTGIPYCVALSSGTAAMHLALLDLDVGPGDEVIASTLTFIGSVTPVTFLGAKTVFIDCDRESWNMDPDLLAEELAICAKRGKMPKAVIPTDLYGQCCDYEQIFEICGQYDVPVIVDAAEAMGAFFQKSETRNQRAEVGSQKSEVREQNSEFGNQKSENQLKIQNSKFKIAYHAGWGAKAAVFSFNGNKIMTTSGGGMLASDDKDLIDHARFLSQQASDPFPHYEHSEIGYNYRMSNILAAIGRGQLKVLDERVKRKREIFDYYQGALGDIAGIEFMPEPEWSRSNRWLTVILITPDVFGADREQVRLALEDENIESRPVWKPMHLQPVFHTGDPEIESKKRASDKKRYPCRSLGGQVSEDLFNRGLCLPSGTAMTETDLERVVDTILKCKN
jgi:dTDP-4-amino-4,6-dideoxygalactose transaminase